MDTIFALVLGLVAGVAYYFIDKSKMRGAHRSWYALTHKHPLPADVHLGFVYGQPFSGKVYSAFFLSAVLTLLIILTGTANVLVQLLYGAFIFIGVLVAFYLTPLILNHGVPQFEKIQDQLEKVDEIESKHFKSEPTAQEDAHSKPVEEAKTGKKDDDWRKGINDYLNG